MGEVSMTPGILVNVAADDYQSGGSPSAGTAVLFRVTAFREWSDYPPDPITRIRCFLPRKDRPWSSTTVGCLNLRNELRALARA